MTNKERKECKKFVGGITVELNEMSSDLLLTDSEFETMERHKKILSHFIEKCDEKKKPHLLDNSNFKASDKINSFVGTTTKTSIILAGVVFVGSILFPAAFVASAALSIMYGGLAIVSGLGLLTIAKNVVPAYKKVFNLVSKSVNFVGEKLNFYKKLANKNLKVEALVASDKIHDIETKVLKKEIKRVTDNAVVLGEAEKEALKNGGKVTLYRGIDANLASTVTRENPEAKPYLVAENGEPLTGCKLY